MTKMPWQKLKYHENEKSFQDEIKTFFIIFKGLSIKQVTQIFLQGENPTLTNKPTFTLTPRANKRTHTDKED